MTRSLTILCVDYNPDALTILKEQLERAGHTIVLADTLRYAMTVISSIMLDFVLLNHTLPEGDACKIIIRLQQINVKAQIVTFLDGRPLPFRSISPALAG